MYEYKIVENCRQDGLGKKVNEHLAEGWRCQGGVDVAGGDNNEWYYQAMIREVEDKELTDIKRDVFSGFMRALHKSEFKASYERTYKNHPIKRRLFGWNDPEEINKFLDSKAGEKFLEEH